MNEKINEILARVAVETFEKLAFIFAFPSDEEDQIPTDSGITARVSFEGSFSGTLAMSVPGEVLLELTENMLGMGDGEEMTENQQHDALKEAINIVCGNLLPAIGGKESVFKIHAPEIITGAGALGHGVEAEPISMARLDIDDSPCDLLLFVDGEIPMKVTG